MSEAARVALVTGASRGIGLAISRALAQDGFDLVLNDIARQEAELKAAQDEITGMGRRCAIALADVRDEVEVARMVEAALAEFGQVHAVVNNAGILIPASAEELSGEVWDAVMDVNAKGTFLVIRALLPSMRRHRYGRIVNIASIGGKHGAPLQSHYSASKAAVMGFTRVLAQEVGPEGITANCVCPGIIVTEMGRKNLGSQENIDRWIGNTAMRRLGEPEDVAGAVCFLASDRAAFITGQSLNVCGGIVLS
ncbi:MAG TPA: SDR family NAD(P)-dependent oxidoreductase [Acetobacteraceae bacterium]|nr:SDR family NAD(P)-dependent oxidoreductase [Acetobacteraceae bacterium]